MVRRIEMESGKTLSGDWTLDATTRGRHANFRRKAVSAPVIDIQDVRKAMHEISLKKGDFSLFALFKRADALGTWDLVVSAPWLESGKLKALGEFTSLLSKSVDREWLAQFSRVEAVPSSNPTVQYILANIPVENGERHIQSTDLFGLQIDEAIILRAEAPSPGRRPGRTLHSVGAGTSCHRR